MSPQQITTASVLDILFEHRNKGYGAYELRSHYHKRLLIAVAVLPLVVLLAWQLQPDYEKIQTALDEIKPYVTICPIEIPEAVIQPPPPAATQRPAARGAAIPTEIVPDELVPPVDNTLLLGGTSDGDPTITPAEVTSTPTPAATGAANTAPTPITEPVQNFTTVEKLPQFPGGAQAWLQFLQRYLRVPDELAAGQKVQVQVRFTVSTDGSISEAVIVQSGGATFDAEVKRVLKKMPRWSPAVQNGRPVAVSFVQPVTFAAVEE